MAVSTWACSHGKRKARQHRLEIERMRNYLLSYCLVAGLVSWLGCSRPSSTPVAGQPGSSIPSAPTADPEERLAPQRLPSDLGDVRPARAGASVAGDDL